VDTCSASQNQCINRPEPLLCRCDTIDPPDVTHKFTKSLPLPEVECPFIGGKTSASIDINSTWMGKEASCYNNCEASSSGDMGVAFKASLCGASGEETGTGKYQYKATHCLECGPGCIQTCGKGACIESGGGGSVAVSTEKPFKGFRKTAKGPVGIEFKCGGTWGASLTTEVGYQSTEDAGSCMNCPDCSKLTSTLTGSANAQWGCSFKAPGNREGSGCLACASLSAKETGGATGQWGACGNESCPMVKVDVEGAVQAKVALSFGFWHVEGECAAKLIACSEANACGTCSCEGCRDFKSDLHACKVTSTLKLQ
jgi:hypothetical protein